ncbi:MAG: ATP-binding protein [Treponema sp.]|nr:ATP-binding protein [Treponema sp.]
MKRTAYFNTIDAFRNKQIIKIFTGIRRCGKSVLMEQYIQKLRIEGVSDDQITYLRLDDLENELLLNYSNLYAFIKSGLIENKMNYVFIDEVQLCEDFQKAVESLFNYKNVDLYLTGSNAEILSGELATLLSGRYVSIDMLPFSFSEYLECAKENNYPDQSIEEHYDDYVRFGSLPFTLQLEKNQENIYQYLNGVYNTIIVKDIARRHQIKDVSILESVIRFMFNNCGNICSSKKISDTLTSGGRKTSQPTVESYMHFLEECFLVYKVERYDVRGKEILKNLAKYYIADTGLRNMLLGFRNIDTGHILENMIFLELKRKKFEIFTGRNHNAEIDFVVKNQRTIIYIQVAESVKDEATLQRELSAFNNIKDSYPRLLITMDRSPNEDFNGVRHINAFDFLLGRVSLYSTG